VQTEVKCPVSIHPGMNKESPTEVLRVFQEAGGDGRKVTVCHLDSKFSGEMLHYFVHFISFFNGQGLSSKTRI
jgi:predicted metal-dependent phosphotriesterase family hydrolase